MTPFLSRRNRGLAPYVPGEQPRDQQYIKLNTNESPFPPSAGVLRAVAREAAALNLYSDPDLLAARQALARRYQVGPENVLLTNGSDEALGFIFQAYGDEESPFAFPDITYGLYPILCRLYHIPFEVLPLREDFSVDVDACLRTGKHLMLANPNAPTGIALERETLRRIAEADPGRLLIVDEAYVDFGAESCVPLIRDHDNVLVVQTFSKSRSLAGARLGFLIGPAPLIAEINAVRCSFNPYNVNRMSLAAAVAAIEEDAVYAENCRQIEATRQWTEKELRRLGFRVLPSRANFLFAAPPGIDGGAYYRLLKARGILVRHFSQPRIASFVRISIGTQKQMQTLIETTQAILEEAKP